MFCKNCGQLLNQSDRQCAKCGMPVDMKPINGSEGKALNIILKSRTVKMLLKYVIPSISIILFFYGCWKLIDYIHGFIDLEQMENNNFDGGDILTVVFGVGSSILSLVGLITIFVSINSQHRIQRCREVLWELMELPYQCWSDMGKFNYKFSIEQGIRQRLILYQQTLKSGLFFNNLIVIFLFVIILLIAGSIMLTIQVLRESYFTNNTEYHYIFSIAIIGVVIMILFAILILTLGHIRLIASLPKLKDIMDTNTQKSDIPGILLAAMCMRVIPSETLILRCTFPFQHFKVYPWITGTLKNTNQEVLINGGPFYGNTSDKALKTSFIDHNRAHRLHYVVMDNFDTSLYETVTYKFKLTSKQGKVIVEFKQDIRSESEVDGRLHPINIIPKLTIESELFKELDFE